MTLTLKLNTKMKVFAWTIFLILLNAHVSLAQVFTDVTAELGVAAISGSTIYGGGASAFDVNEDGWDDLTLCIPGAPTRLYINNQGVFQLLTSFENIYDSKTCLWGDYDEDGDNDLFVIKRDGPSQLFVQTDSLVFVNQSNLLNFSFLSIYQSFGAALGDYNRDSYLDLYVANYSTATAGGVKSLFFTNNQNGTYNASPHGYSRNHFQPAFIDLYRDLYQDLFIINDFRTGSELYTQDISGAFTDLTNSGALGLSGMAYLDAMTNSWCDYDNDSDLDLYVSNTPNYGNFLFQNNGLNNFTNVASSAGAALGKWSWSALWFDIENDGWNDLIVNERHINLLYQSQFGIHVLRNNQGLFSEDNSTGISGLPYGYFTSSKGDFNNDGLYDLYLGAESAQQSRVFRNNSSSNNNYVKCRLKGRLSNRNGVGTYIDYYVGGSHRVHYTQLGENYLCQNSQNLIFGLGSNTVIDSLKLSWISGVVDTYYNIPANTTHVFVEGETMPQIQASKPFLCPIGTDSLQLTLAGWPVHTWSNGSTENAIWVNSPGIYSVTVGTGFGHTIQLSYEVQLASQDNFNINRTQVLCNGGNDGSIEVVNVISGEVIYSLNNLSAGMYTVPVTIFEGCVSEQVVGIDEPLPFGVAVDSIVNACHNQANGSALLIGIDGTAPFTGFNEFGVLQLSNLSPGTYSNTVSDANGCLATYNFVIDEIPAAVIEMTSPAYVCQNELVIFEASVYNVGSNYTWDVLAPGALLGAGDYVSAVVDTFQCVTTFDFAIEEVQPPTVAAVISQNTLGMGSILLDVVGNYPPYTATWQSGFVGLNYTGLSSGTYNVSISDSMGCAIDTMFTVLIDFVEEEKSSAEFFVDWKMNRIKYTGTECLFGLEVFNDLGQLLISKNYLFPNEEIPLSISPQPLYISSSKGNRRIKVVLR